MKYIGMLILLAGTLISAQEAAKFHLIARNGSYLVSLDGVTMKLEANHYIEREVFPGRHSLGYQIGYFGDWTLTSLKVTAGQNYYFVFSFAPEIGRTCAQLSSAQGELCMRAMENKGGGEECQVGMNSLYPSFKPFPVNLLPGGLYPH